MLAGGVIHFLGIYPFALDVKGGEEVSLVLPSMPKGEIVGMMDGQGLSLMEIVHAVTTQFHEMMTMR